MSRPPGRPGHKPLVRYKRFQYQASSWTKPRRIVAKVEHHQGELFPRVGFIVTNMNLPHRSVVRFYNKRGTAEQWIKEGKQATNWTRLSCHRFRANGATPAQCPGGQPWEALATTGAASVHRQWVLDQCATAPRQDRWPRGETCAILLADAGGESPDPPPVRGEAPTHLCSAASCGLKRERLPKDLVDEETADGRRGTGECRQNQRFHWIHPSISEAIDENWATQ